MGNSAAQNAPSSGAIVNRLADANPELGAAILAQRKRFQNITQINLPVSMQKKSLSLVFVIFSTLGSR